MIWNIIDRRERPYRWKTVNAVIEAVEHDNSVIDADKAPDADIRVLVDYAEREAVSVHDAVVWASGQQCPVTLYLYDKGAGIGREEHFQAQAVRFPNEDNDEATSL